MVPFLVVMMLTVVYGQMAPVQHCIHNNLEQHTADMVIEQLFKEMDTNKDGSLTMVEVFTEIFGRFDDDGDLKIAKDGFVTHWHNLFHDVKPFAEYIFYHFDQNDDGFIDMYDAPMLNSIIDLNHDGQATGLEFGMYMSHLYNDCVPHNHRDPSVVG